MTNNVKTDICLKGHVELLKNVPRKKHVSGMRGYQKYKIDMYNLKCVICMYFHCLVYPIGINIFPIGHSLLAIGYFILPHLAYGDVLHIMKMADVKDSVLHQRDVKTSFMRRWRAICSNVMKSNIYIYIYITI